MIKKLPEIVQKQIDNYRHLNLGDKEVRCPYYMNLKRTKDLRAMVGKGTPEEIELESKIWEKIKGVNFKEMSETQIREFLINRGIGIDCSGFVIHVLNEWYKDEKGKNIWRDLKIPNRSILFKIAYMLKPVEKLGAEIITSDLNAEKVEINDVLPGDLIRLKWKVKNSHHIILISEVEKDDKKNVKRIGYVHSIPFYKNENGIKTGEIIITDPKLPLEKQNWTEVDENGVNHVLEGYMIELADNGLRRLKVMEEIIK